MLLLFVEIRNIRGEVYLRVKLYYEYGFGYVEWVLFVIFYRVVKLSVKYKGLEIIWLIFFRDINL